MAKIKRSAQARWDGTLKEGKGSMNTESAVLKGVPYSFGTRFENEPGTNPEELIAEAQAACYSMAFALYLEKKGYKPGFINTKATCTLESQNGGFKITGIAMDVTGQVEGVSEDEFSKLAHEADAGCPVSNLLRPGLEVHELKAHLK